MKKRKQSRASNESRCSEEKKYLTISIPLKKGEPLGITPNEHLFIVKIQPGTKCEGSLHIGDQIVALNGIKLKDANQFQYFLSVVTGLANITVIRDDKISRDMEESLAIPEDRRCNIMRREGYKYELININLVEDKKLGLSIRHFQNRVLITNIAPSSIASMHLKIGDHICDVDGLRVTDKVVCRRLLLSILKTNKKVSLVIERPVSQDAIKWVKKVLDTPENQPPSVKMHDDVVEITLRERIRIKSYGPPEKTILRQKGCHYPKRNVTFDENVLQIQITSDHDEKKASFRS